MSMEKIELKIRTIGDDILRAGTKQVPSVSEYHRKLLSEMARLMYEVSGVGLAAPQIGVDQSLFVADAGSGLYKIINPKVIKKEGSQVMEEGCLSVPGVGVKVKRFKKITIEALDQDGKCVVIEAEDLLARVFQHEIDHLNGKLIVDYASIFERKRIKKQLGKLKRID